jgi:heme/copper-type cytochrome/quinol oxidase subunit 2
LGSSVGQRIGEMIITALWPLIWVIYVLVSIVIIVEAAVVYLSWGVVARVDRLLKKSGPQTDG